VSGLRSLPSGFKVLEMRVRRAIQEGQTSPGRVKHRHVRRVGIEGEIGGKKLSLPAQQPHHALREGSVDWPLRVSNPPVLKKVAHGWSNQQKIGRS